MLLPTKRLSTEKSLLVVGARVLIELVRPQTISHVWDRVSRHYQSTSLGSIDFEWFVLALDFLFAIGSLEFRQGRLHRRVIS
jgi:hypothetical protein